MADSAQARASTFEVCGIMMNPVPHGADSAADRSQFNDVYAGITAQLPKATSETCWVNSATKSSTWKNPKSISSGWKNENSQTKVWTAEKEVVPC